MEKKLLTALLLMLVLCVSIAWPHTTALAAPPGHVSLSLTAPEDAPFVPGRVLVKLRATGQHTLPLDGKPALGRRGLDGTLASAGVQKVMPLFPSPLLLRDGKPDPVAIETGLPRFYRLDLAPDQDVLAVAATLSQNPDVEYAEPDYLARPVAAPNDPRYTEQWGLAKIQAEGGWQVTQGNAAVVVAIIDSGIDRTHPDLQPNLWVNPGEIANNGLDDDGDGLVDDVNGWNFTASDGGNNDVQDQQGHGTTVAGVAGARTNNAAGIAGVCGRCRVMPVKVIGASNTAGYADIAAGMVYATAKGARVINLSLGGYAPSKTLLDAVANAIGHNVVVVAGVGNDGRSDPFYPAAYPEVVAVAGLTNAGTRAANSNCGAWVDLAAPGANILSTTLGGGYTAGSATSIAAPFVSGAAGLLLTWQNAWTPAQVHLQLVRTANPAGIVDNPGQLGSGWLNAAQALTLPRPMLVNAGVTVIGEPGGQLPAGATANLAFSLRNDWSPATAVNASLTSTDPLVTVNNGTVAYGNIATGQVVINTTPFVVNIASAAGYLRPLRFSLALTANGGTYAKTLEFTVTTSSDVRPLPASINSHMTLTNNYTWQAGSDVQVGSGVTLTIQPGTAVKFLGDYTLRVFGTMVADGTAAQPISFLPPDNGTWRGLTFGDTSVDASVTANGAFQRGTILRHVRLQGAAQGVICENAAPYLSYLESDQGGLACALGGAALWLLDGRISGNVSSDGTVHAWRTQITQGRLDVGKNSEVIESHVGRAISLGYYGTVRDTTSGEGITINGDGHIERSVAWGPVTLFNGDVISSTVTSAGIGINRGNLRGNKVTCGLMVADEGDVTGNTVIGGGINVRVGHLVKDNTVQDAPEIALYIRGTPTIVGNRVLHSGGFGIYARGGVIQGNLIDGTVNDGMHMVGPGQVLSNTFTGNGILAGPNGAVAALWISTQGVVTVEGNNFEFNRCPYNLYYEDTVGIPISAQRNWWGTADVATLRQRIHDVDNHVDSSMPLSGPAQDAPPYVRDVTHDPAGTVGIQLVSFDVHFSRPMDPALQPALQFGSERWQGYTSTNSGLAAGSVNSVAVDGQGQPWFGHSTGDLSLLRTNGTWRIYTEARSLGSIGAIYIDAAGNTWLGGNSRQYAMLDTAGAWHFGTLGSRGAGGGSVAVISADRSGNMWFGEAGADGGAYVLRSDTSWQTYTPANSGLPDASVEALAVDADGNQWFGTTGGHGFSVLRTDGSWQTYTTFNSGLIRNDIAVIVVDEGGNKWIGTWGNGVSVLQPDGGWLTYHAGNSGLAGSQITAIATDTNGNRWFASNDLGVSVMHPDGTWQNHVPENSGLALASVRGLALAGSELRWFVHGDGPVSRLRSTTYPIVDSPQWPSPSQYRARYSLTALISQDAYSITVANAASPGGLMIAPDTNYSLTVTYPNTADPGSLPGPAVFAWSDGALTTLRGDWLPPNPKSQLTGYRYAIGTTPGGIEVVNWTTVAGTDLVRTGLSLAAGVPYYIAVQVRNTGGVWGVSGISKRVIAGERMAPPPKPPLYLPLFRR